MTLFHRSHHDDPATHKEREEPDSRAVADGRAHEAYGGINWGAAFFGWLTAIALTVLMSAIIGAAASAVGENTNLSMEEAQQEAGSIGLAGAIALAVVLLIAYYAGGYVAGRMSRFDGVKQGLAVWVIGLVVTILAAVAGWLLGSEYNILERTNMPNIPLPDDVAAIGGLITAGVVLLVTLGGAIAGGKLGQRYHSKVDRVRHV